MHKNLITTFNLNEELNSFENLRGFQPLRSEQAYGTFFSIYGKIKGVVNKNKNTFIPDEAVFYLQNFKGNITVGIDNEKIEIDTAFDEETKLPVYMVNFFVSPLKFKPFLPDNFDLIDENENLIEGEKLRSVSFKLKSQPSILDLIKSNDVTTKANVDQNAKIENFEGVTRGISTLSEGFSTSEENIKQKIRGKDPTLIGEQMDLNLKIIFDISFSCYNSNEKESLNKQIFIDPEFYVREGEDINQNLNQKTRNVTKAVISNFIGTSYGKRIYDPKCKSCFGTFIVE